MQSRNCIKYFFSSIANFVLLPQNIENASRVEDSLRMASDACQSVEIREELSANDLLGEKLLFHTNDK